MEHFCDKIYFCAYLKLYPTGDFPLEMLMASGSQQGPAEVINGSLPLLDSGYRLTLPASTTSQSLLSWSGMATSSGVTFLVCSSESHSDDQCPEETSSLRCRASHSSLPYLTFTYWRNGFWTKCVNLFPNHWVSILLTPPLGKPFSWCVSYIIGA